MIAGGKDKYVCLLTLIKNESKPLYELICDLCLDHTFRSQRYQNTFLMPNDKLVKKIKNMYDDDKDEEAIKAIRSLLLKGHLNKESFKKDAVIGTIDADTILADPAAVGKHVSNATKTIIVTKKNAYATVVLLYAGAESPATTTGKSGGFIPVGTVMGGQPNKDAEQLKAFTQSMIVDGNDKATFKNFAKGVSYALSMLLKKDTARYNRAKFYLAENPILSWFFLTMPGSDNGLVKCSDLGEFNYHHIQGCNEHISNAMTAGGYKFDGALAREIKDIRSKMRLDNPKDIPMIIQSTYKKHVSNWADKFIDETLRTNVMLKLLMDECRYIYESSVSNWDQVSDVISSLGCINWNDASNSLVASCSNVNRQLNSPEVYASGPIAFISSIYFMYVPLSKDIAEKLGGMQGGAEHANPATIRNVIYSGGAARKKMYSAGSNFDAKAMVDLMTPEQREQLKAAL